MGGKRKKHKPKYRPKQTPKEHTPEKPIQRSEYPLVVFISSKIDSMMSERDAADRAIKSIPITGSWRFEYTPASSQSLEDSYLSYVRSCDIFILLLGLEHSNAVDREYQTALENQRPILAFVQKGERDSKQNDLVDKLDLKYSSYTNPDNLEKLVLASVLDELIRRFRSTIKQDELPKLIESLPAPARKPEEVSGYVLLGMADDSMDQTFELFGVKKTPANLEELYPSYEQVYFDNLSEMKEVFEALARATTKARNATADQGNAYLHAISEEAMELTSHYIVRKKTGKQAPQIEVPGMSYFIFAVAPDIARYMMLMRYARIKDQPINVQRTEYEYLFKNVEYFFAVLKEMHQASQQAGDDLDEFFRLLLLAAMRLRLPQFMAEAKEKEDKSEE